jgi:hypothetical protein
MGSYGCHVTSLRCQLSPTPLSHWYKAEKGFGTMALVLAVLNSGAMSVPYRLVAYVPQHCCRGKKDIL